MIRLYFKRAYNDLRHNRLLNVVTIITIAFSILIVSAFLLFFSNTSDVINLWKKGVRVMVYLKDGVSESRRTAMQADFESMEPVVEARFISKAAALARLKSQMARQASLFDGLTENPLPDAFELTVATSVRSWRQIETLASSIEKQAAVAEVEYGQEWIGRFRSFFSLFTITGYAMSALFFMATVFIVANTIRLVIYSRSEEVEIMRLVGASDRFIQIPFYIEGVVQGLIGALIGLSILAAAYLFLAARMSREAVSGFFNLHFLETPVILMIVLGSMGVGLLGCFLSLQQYLKVRG
jgi:cell division transport system permease protein